MPRKSESRGLRRLKLVEAAGGLGVVIGAVALFSAIPDALHHRAGGVAGVAMGLVPIAAGIGPVIWGIRNEERVRAGDTERTQAQGLDDGLPPGAFREQQDIGLEATDVLLVVALVFVGFGLVFTIAGATEPAVGLWIGLAFAFAVGLVPAAICIWLGTGTRLWLTPEGIERRRWPARFTRWSEIDRIVPVYRGHPQQKPNQLTQVLELRTRTSRPRWSRYLVPSGFPVRVGLLEVSPTDLVRMIEARIASADEGESAGRR